MKGNPEIIQKMAFYCSGKASRVLKFYEKKKIIEYPVSFIFYDGNDKEVEFELRKISTTITLDSIKNIESLKETRRNDFLLAKLIEFKIDYLFCFGNKIFKGEILEIYENKIINFHPSLLPAFPGLNSIDKALASNVQILGNTAHFIDKGIDSGPIIMQSVLSRQNYTSYEDVLSLQIDMLERIWNLLIQDKIFLKNGKVFIDDTIQKSIFFSI